MVAAIFGMNEQAVAKLHARDYKSAARLFQKCMSILEEAYEGHMSVDDCEDNEVAGLHVTVAPTTHELSVRDDLSAFSVYNFAMHLHPWPQGLDDDDDDEDEFCLSEDDYNLLGAVLLYNYGLCLHLCGITTGCEHFLKHSLELYNEALGPLGMLEPSNVSFLLELALLNNQGHIYHMLLEGALLRECMERMRLVLYGATVAWSQTIPPVLSSFANNLLFNASTQRARPAAAA